jgi:hypothetical protein
MWKLLYCNLYFVQSYFPYRYFFYRYETGSSLLTDTSCQLRAVCEVYRYQQQLGELSRRARHSLDYLGPILQNISAGNF